MFLASSNRKGFVLGEMVAHFMKWGFFFCMFFMSGQDSEGGQGIDAWLRGVFQHGTRYIAVESMISTFYA